MDIIHQVVISNTPSFKGVTTFIDIMKPIDAKRAFICVNKFNASYPLQAVGPDTFPPTEEFEVRCDAIQNSYSYTAATGMVTRSDLLDTFVTKDISQFVLGGTTEQVACFNISNNNDNWMEIDLNRLPQIKFTFVNNLLANNQTFNFNLHLKVRFTG
jgi:hypothetical protein